MSEAKGESSSARRRRAAYRLGRQLGQYQGQRDLIRQIAAVAEAVAFQAGEPATEIAGMIVSALALTERAELMHRFMAEGTELFVDGTMTPFIKGESGTLSFRAANGSIRHPDQQKEASQ